MDSEIFYDKNSVKVTDKRFIVGNKTFVLSNVTSIDSSKSSVIFFKILGLILVVAGIGITLNAVSTANIITDTNTIDTNTIDTNNLSYLFLSVIGGLFFLPKDKYSVILKTAGADNNVYSSKNKQEIDEIIEALNKSIASSDNTLSNSSDNTSIADELRKLTELKNENVLTTEEFESQKAILLNRGK